MTSLGRKLEGKVRLNLWVKRLKNGLKISVDLSLLAEELPVPRRATRFSRNFFESIEFVSRRLDFIRAPSRPSCKIKQLSLFWTRFLVGFPRIKFNNSMSRIVRRFYFFERNFSLKKNVSNIFNSSFKRILEFFNTN